MTDNNCGIYTITNTVNGKQYVGSSKNIPHRWACHKGELRHNCHRNLHLTRAWDKYGEKAFVFKIELLCEANALYYYEQAYIDTLKPEYNIALCAEAPTRGTHWSDETRAKQAKRVMSDETRRKLSEAKKGKHLSDETKRKQSEALKGRKLSEEQILQLIAYNTGRKHTEETRKHMSEAHIGKPSNWRGKHHTEEAKLKMSEAQHKRHKDHPATEETRRKLSEAQKGHPNYNLEPPSEETKRKTSESLKRYWAERKLANANTPTPDCYRTENLDTE